MLLGAENKKSPTKVIGDGKRKVVPRRGFEPPTYRLGICRSVQLSYRGAKESCIEFKNADGIAIPNLIHRQYPEALVPVDRI